MINTGSLDIYIHELAAQTIEDLYLSVGQLCTVGGAGGREREDVCCFRQAILPFQF